MASEASPSPKETRSSVFSRTAHFTTKRALRATEKVMQKLGKSEATKDNTIAEFVGNFHKQQATANRLNKEVKKYMDALRSMATASKHLGDCFHDMYEPEWAGQVEVNQSLDELCDCHSELSKKLQQQLCDPVSAYLAHFSEMKSKISKHDRKVVDYDRRRRNLEQLKKDKQTKGKISDAKIAQAEAEFEEARRVYDDLTNELYEELPTFYDSRIPFYAAIFQSLYVAEAAFHSAVTTLKTQLNDLMDVAAQDAASRVHSTRKPRVKHAVTALAMSLDVAPDDEAEEDDEGHGDEQQQEELGHQDEEELDVTTADQVDNVEEDEVPAEVKETESTSKEKKDKPAVPKRRDSFKKMSELSKPSALPRPDPQPSSRNPLKSRSSPTLTLSSVEDEGGGDMPEKLLPVEDKEKSASELHGDELTDPTILYTVEATHPYSAQDEDELAFEKGDKIDVIPFDDPDEQDDGWLLGVKTSDGKRGVFPENFTKRID